MSIAEYYNQRAKYQLLPYDEDWDTVIEKFSKVIDTRLRYIFGDKKLKVLDCTCGIGTQAISCAKLGHHIWASDISSEMIKYAQKYSAERGENIHSFIQDVREPFSENYKNKFDAVLSLNNSLVFVSNNKNADTELTTSFKNIFDILNDNGIFMISLRPYDEYLISKPLSPPNREYKFRKVGDDTVKFYQRYDWLDDNKHYICKTFYDFLQNDGSINTVSEEIKIRAWREKEIVDKLKKSGFTKIHTEIIEDKTGHYREKWFLAVKNQ